MSNVPLKTDGTARNIEIQRAVKQNEEKLVRDTIILQKVNKAHRDAFKEKYPGQIEHCMRLTAERLQAILAKKPSDLSNTQEWSCTAGEIADLSEALYHLSLINQLFPIKAE